MLCSSEKVYGHPSFLRTFLAVLLTRFPPYIPLPKQPVQTYPYPATFDKEGTRFFTPPPPLVYTLLRIPLIPRSADLQQV